MDTAGNSGGYADVLVGLQYGDEGKAKVIDLLAPSYDIVARFNGGANAGHTVDTPAGAAVLQQVPSAVFHSDIELYIGSGCALTVWKLAAELRMLGELGFEPGRLTISDRCAIVQPGHVLLDGIDGGMINTTKNGIGPCYAARATRHSGDHRVNLQLADLLNAPEDAAAAMRCEVEALAPRVADEEVELAFARLAALPEQVEAIRPLVARRPDHMTARVAGGARVLFEGAQSVMLDVVHGQQPYVTSSHTVPAQAYVGGDLSPRHHRLTIGVAKAVVSRVGNGPFPSELGAERAAAYFESACREGRGRTEERAEFDPDRLLTSEDPLDLGIAMRMLTGEYGSGTGRPRRIGMLDLVQLREIVAAFGVDVLYINKVDCLELFERSLFGGIPMRTVEDGDVRVTVLTPLRRDADGGAHSATSLEEIRAVIEEHVGIPVAGMGVGQGRDDLVQFRDLEASR
jgi:adenylosuccinate synthase